MFNRPFQAGTMQTIVLFDVEAPRDPNFFAEPPSLHAVLEERTRGVVDGCACNNVNLVPHRNHPFVNAAQVAYSLHLPLVLSPDDVWLCIIDAFALHVNLNAEALCDRLVSHEGRELITVRRH